MQFFYSGQIRRFIIQFIREFSGFQVEFGIDANNNPIYQTVPVRYADTNAAVAAIITGNSENAIQNIPMMVAYMDGVKYDRDRVQNPTFVDKKQIRERLTDPLTGDIRPHQKNLFTVERLMPVPYKLTMKLDICTGSTEQKLQLFEQLAVLFNPSREIQNSDNWLDWSSLSCITLTDNTLSSRSIPIGTVGNTIDIMTMTFEMPIWITPPAKIKRLSVVTGIVASLYDAHGNPSKAIEDQFELMGKRQWFTPMGYDAVVSQGKIRLARTITPESRGPMDTPIPANAPVNWHDILSLVGELTAGVTQVAFIDENTNNTVIGTVRYDPTDISVLLFDVDPATVPVNNIPAITNVVDPRLSGPGSGLPAAAQGHRYLLINHGIGNTANAPQNSPKAWQNFDGSPLFAKANDIVEYDGERWNVVFDSADAPGERFLVSSFNNVQYHWVNGSWSKSWEGLYREGLFQVII